MALTQKNLGRWAMLLELRTDYLLYRYSKTLREIRRLAHTDVWFLSVTPPGYLIYAMYHLYYNLVYIGITSAAPIRRLRKHMCDALAHTDNATLHLLMAKIDLYDWGIAPLVH